MSREGKAEVQVSHPGLTFPFGSANAPPHPHVNQWCRFTVPERLPLKPFRQDRLTRLPLPPSAMATCKSVHNTGIGALQAYNFSEKQTSGSIDPFQKIHLLEKNLMFVRESHSEMLKGLHQEIADLKQKNRELLFQVVTGLPPLPNEKESKNIKSDISEDQKEKIEKLEKEIKKLKDALKDAVKTNSSLTIQLKQLKSEQQYSKPTSYNKRYNKTPDSAIDDGRQISSPAGPSPQMEEYCDTLRQIQRAANHRSGRRDDRRYPRDDNYKNDWSDSHLRNGHGYHHHNHRQYHRQQAQKSPQQQQQQPRLPRLPLRNQQNYQQRENEYHIRCSNALPALKQPLVPMVDHRFDKPRKSRGPRAPKLADQVTNA